MLSSVVSSLLAFLQPRKANEAATAESIITRPDLSQETKARIQYAFAQWQQSNSALPIFQNLHPDLVQLLVVSEVTKTLFDSAPKLSLQEYSNEVWQILAGMTITVSTLPNAFMPDRANLLETFNQLRPFSQLSEGGRAFTKHCHRHFEFWGQAKGNAAKVNEIALKKIETIIDQATWRNVFYLPGNLSVCELRIEKGYGARWSWAEGKAVMFRGFLEPPQADGHEVGWKH